MRRGGIPLNHDPRRTIPESLPCQSRGPWLHFNRILREQRLWIVTTTGRPQISPVNHTYTAQMVARTQQVVRDFQLGWDSSGMEPGSLRFMNVIYDSDVPVPALDYHQLSEDQEHQ